LLPGTIEVDEVMQEISLALWMALWKKFSQFNPDTEFLKWAYVVARYELLMFRRRKARDRHIFHEDLLELLAEEYTEKAEPLQDERRALSKCLTALPVPDHKLLMTCYSKDMKIDEVAHRLGRTSTSLYKKLNRLREALLQCIDRATRSQLTQP
jgi:RNA polymerase sigma-70 factor, ECF subfamily